MVAQTIDVDTKSAQTCPPTPVVVVCFLGKTLQMHIPMCTLHAYHVGILRELVVDAMGSLQEEICMGTAGGGCHERSSRGEWIDQLP